MDKTDALIISVTLIVVVVFTAWWLSQEWQACTKLHDTTSPLKLFVLAMTDHPLTDEICDNIAPWSLQSPCGYTNMRSAADWQLEQVVEWLRENLYWEEEEDGSVRYVYGNGFASICTTEVIADLKKAMRPQEEDNQ